MIRHDQNVLIGWIILNRPGSEVIERLRIGHIDFTDRLVRRVYGIQLIVALKMKAPGVAPVAIPSETAHIPIQLGDDIDAIR